MAKTTRPGYPREAVVQDQRNVLRDSIQLVEQQSVILQEVLESSSPSQDPCENPIHCYQLFVQKPQSKQNQE